MSHGLHIKGWATFIFIGMFATPVIINAEKAQERIGNEATSMAKVVGDESADKLISRANTIYTDIFVKTGITDAIESKQSSEEGIRKAKTFWGGLADHGLHGTNAYLKAAVANMYGFILRLVLLLAWLPLLLPMIIGVVGDAYSKRMIRISSFAYFSPALYNFALHAVIFALMLPITYLIVPIVMSPLWIPILAFMAYGATWLLIQHMQRVWK